MGGRKFHGRLRANPILASRGQATSHGHRRLGRDSGHFICRSRLDYLGADSFLMKVRWSSPDATTSCGWRSFTSEDAMRSRLLSPTFLFSAFLVTTGVGLAQRASATQITFVQSAQSRAQTPPQQGLPPEKKKSLSKYGPEDVFPGANEQEENRARNQQPKAYSTPTPRPQSAYKRSTATATSSVSPSGPAGRMPSATPMPTPAKALSPPATASPSPATVAARPIAATPSPTIVVATMVNQLRQPDVSRQSALFPFDAKWNAPILSGMALVVFTALVYVLAKLREKIREGSGG
jgi:hypothetical protein